MSKLLKLLSGYKTYMAAFGIVMAGLNMFELGDWQGGILHIIQSKEFVVILSGMGLASLRAGVEKLLIALKEPPKFPDNTASMDDYLFLNEHGKPISKAEYNALMELGVLRPVLGLKSE